MFVCASGFRSSLISTPAKKKKKPAFFFFQFLFYCSKSGRGSGTPSVDMGEEKELCSLGELVLEKWEKATVVCFSGRDVLVGFYLSRVGAAWLSKGEFWSCLVVWALPWLQGEL